MSWLEYHYGFRDGVACRELGSQPGDCSEASPDYRRGYVDGFKVPNLQYKICSCHQNHGWSLEPGKCFLNINYQPPEE